MAGSSTGMTDMPGDGDYKWYVSIKNSDEFIKKGRGNPAPRGVLFCYHIAAQTRAVRAFHCQIVQYINTSL